MLLTKIKVKNYLSINGESEFPMDPRVTVLLGANDHGKSNLLRSLEHLNFDRPILADDENWDSKGARIDFTFCLTGAEIEELRSLLVAASEKLKVLEEREGEAAREEFESNEEPDEDQDSASSAPAAATPSTAPVLGVNAVGALSLAVPKVASAAASIATPADEDEEVELDEPSREEIESDIRYLEAILNTAPESVFYRDGIGAPLSLNGRSIGGLEDEIQQVLAGMIPRVELFKAFSGELQDSVTGDEIARNDSEFLQGIFFYAGLNPLDCSALFEHDDETDKRLEEASRELDTALREQWAQGVDLDLHFQLKHRGSSIELRLYAGK